MTRIWLIWAGLVVATLAACAVACIAAMLHGGRITVMAFVLVPMILMGMAAFLSMGYAVGFWVRSWFVPPLLVVVGYVRPQVEFLRSIDVYNSASLPWSLVQHPAVSTYAAVLGVLLLVTMAALAWVLASRVLVKKLWAGVLTALCVVALIFAQVIVGSGRLVWVDDDHARWPCHTLTGGMRVCLPADIPGDADLSVAQLTPLVPQLLALDAKWSTGSFIPGEPQQGELAYLMPIGQRRSVWDQAQSVSGSLGQDCMAKWMNNANAGQQQFDISEDTLVVAAWLANNNVDQSAGNIGVTLPVSLSTTQASYDRLTACDY